MKSKVNNSGESNENCETQDFNEDELDLGIKHYLRTTRKFGAIEEYDIISEEDA